MQIECDSKLWVEILDLFESLSYGDSIHEVACGVRIDFDLDCELVDDVC
jgi:hypothetical protein